MPRTRPNTLCRLVDRSVRFGAFDPLLNSSRAAGYLRWGQTLSALVYSAALRWPLRRAIIDDFGSMTYRQLDRQADALANYLRRQGSEPVGLLCRNHRGFSLSMLAVERAGRDIVLLSTALPADRLQEIATREELGLVIADAEFDELIAQSSINTPVVSADPGSLAARGIGGFAPRPSRPGGVIMLTSGTTGPPKGARRSQPRISSGSAGIFDAIPLRMNDTTFVASPLYHAWGLAQSGLALGMGSTLVVHQHFDEQATLNAMVEHRVTALAVVPVMLARLLEQAPSDLQLPALRAVMCSGNVLTGTLAGRWIDHFGPNLYNLYGSTETAIASVATPRDLIDAPGTVGRPPTGVSIAILGDDDQPVVPGELGRVFTANGMQFEGYTDGSSRTSRGNRMSTGDLGYLDADGRLFVSGRENDLIVTGGENVFPSRIEEILERHPSIGQAAVVGMADENYGERIVAFVVAAGTFDEAEIETWCRQHLASFQRPREFKVVEALPMTTTGKVIRHALTTLGLPEHI